jgi:hypothetical protein
VLRIVFAIAFLAAMPRAIAHQTSVKYADLTIRDAHTIEVTLRCAATDVTEPMQLPSDATPSVGEALAQPAVAAYVQRWLALRRCTPSAPSARAVDAKFLAVSWIATCERTTSVTLDFTQFFTVDTRHEAIVRLSARDRRAVQTIVRSDTAVVELAAGQSPSVLVWVRTGMAHIYEGVDHILFVLALLLIVMLERTADSWRLRRFWSALRSTGLVITAFTVAHSITLIAASLGVIALPSRPVEIVIALSIAYTAIEDIVRPDVRWRYALTFGFGLVHGLGFAGVLAELLPPTDVVAPLLYFNVGVELGQLTIVLVALPVFFVIATLAGAMRYRRIALPCLGGVVALLGLTMLAERIFNLKILPT